MSVTQELTKQVALLKSGDPGAKHALIEIMWTNFTRLAVQPEAAAQLDALYAWAEANRDREPDFYDRIQLSHGFIAFLQDRFSEAETLLFEAKELFAAKGNPEGVAAACICIGFLQRSTGELDLAMKNGLSAMDELRNTDEFKRFRLMGAYWIGSVYAETGHLEEALAMFQEGIDVNQMEGFSGADARITSGIASVYMKQKKYDLALSHFQKALELGQKSAETTFRPRGLTDIADYYFETGDLPLSIEYNQEALKLRREMKQQNASITNLMNLGRIYFKQNNYQLALDALAEALQIAEEIKVKVKIFAIHRLLSDIYQEMGDVVKCLEHFKKFHDIKEEVNHEDLERRVKNQVQLFKAEQTEKENVIIKAQKIEIENEKKRSDELLWNILPEEVAEELKTKGTAEARQYDEVTVLFTDFKNFTGISEKMTAQELVGEIHACFMAFDNIIEKHGIEKIKTIGDSYMCAGGLPVANKTHATDVVKAGLEIQDFIVQRAAESRAGGKEPFLIRIGVHTGPVVAGIVGIRKFAYDIWGDTVNTASRMESSGEVGKVNISQSTFELVKNKFQCTYRGKVTAKGKGEIDMYFVENAV